MTASVRILGTVEVGGSGRIIDLGPARQRALLAVLVLHPGRAVGADDVVGRLWGDDPPPAARQTLRSYVCRLRQVLVATGLVRIERRGGGYAAEVAPEELDLLVYRRLVREARAVRLDGDLERSLEIYARALGMWTGPALAGVSSPWLDGMRDALGLERHGDEVDHNDIALARGQHLRVLASLTSLAAANPYDERVAGQLMRALHGCGRSTEALARYRSIGRRLRSELGVEPGADLRELHDQVLRGAELVGRQGSPTPGAATSTAPPGRSVPRSSRERATVPHASVAAARDAPHQLPVAPRGFTGRTAELAALDAILDASAGDPCRLAVVSGPGGVGKTAIVVRWAWDRLGAFPDGELYVDLRGFDPDRAPLPPETALHSLVLALGAHPAAVPEGLVALTGLYRSLAADRQILVVADDARCSDQVRPLLPPGPGSALIATSRSRLVGLVGSENARPIPVTTMEPEEARNLLVSRLGAARVASEPPSVDALVRHCAGLPLALTIVAAQAVVDPGLSLDELSASLGSDGDRLEALSHDDAGADLRTVFATSVSAVATDAARCFALLGLATGRSVALDEIAALTALPRVRTAAIAKELLAYHLLEPDVPGRYRMHDLVRLHAVDLARLHPESPVARLRLLEHYRDAGPTDRAGTPAVLAALDDAVSLGLDELVCDLSTCVDSYLRTHGCWIELVRVHECARAAASRLGDLVRLARAQIGLGRGLIGRRDFSTAAAALVSARHVAERSGDLHVQAAAQRASARWAAQQGRHEEALRHDEAVLDLAHRSGDRHTEGVARNAIGWHQMHLGQPAHGLLSCRTALAIIEEEDDPAELAATLDSIGFGLDLLGRHVEAQQHYLRSAAVAELHHHLVQRAETLQRLAASCLRSGLTSQAAEAAETAADLLRQCGFGDTEIGERDRATHRPTGTPPHRATLG
ncbi:MAG TPA: BTAD domain-containing putative transcriptional regulator [Microlunatus sp.]|nr:BTAD domain-containing putative transcriptional regulator [Microlunatus sp.]